MHRVHLGKVAAKRAPRPHLDPPDRIHGAGRLGQRGVARRLPALADGVLEGLRLLAQLVKLVHLCWWLVWFLVFLDLQVVVGGLRSSCAE